jgi:hypothetical protein
MKNQPQFLYKYRPWNPWAKNIISTGDLWYAKIDSFNDPFEGRFDISSDLSVVEAVALATKYLMGKKEEVDFSRRPHSWAYISNYIDSKVLSFDADYGLRCRPEFYERVKGEIPSIADYYRGVGVLSLAAGCDSILMWSHYASNHEGICLEFDVRGSECSYLKPVSYADSYPVARIADLVNDRDALMDVMVYTKSSHWAYEQEWRAHKDEGNKSYPFDGKLRTIILGAKFDYESFGDDVRELADSKGVGLKRAKCIQGQFAIDFEVVLESPDLDSTNEIY